MKRYRVAPFLLILMLTSASAQVPPQSLPRLQQSDLNYLGAFALPQGSFGSSSFDYGGNSVAPYRDPSSGKLTIFMEGHAWHPGNVAQVEVPPTLVKSSNWNSLPRATVLQPFRDITDGKSGTLNNNEGGNNFIYGLLAYNGRLIVGASNYYDAANTQNRSHGASSFNLAATNDFQGFYPISAQASPRSLGGYMGTIPTEWQGLFGGPALTGNCCLSIISNSSSGPAATVFNPDHLGGSAPVSGSTVVYYPVSHQIPIEFNAQTGSSAKGIAFPAGTRSVLFFGVISNPDYCYGPGTYDPSLHKVPTSGGTWCYDPCGSAKGGHGYPYNHAVYAFDANDLLKVKSGEKQSWEIIPYATWRLNEMTNNCAGMSGAGYDAASRRMYIAQNYGGNPRIDVYEIATLPVDTTPPDAPGNLRTVQ